MVMCIVSGSVVLAAPAAGICVHVGVALVVVVLTCAFQDPVAGHPSIVVAKVSQFHLILLMVALGLGEFADLVH